MLREVRRDHRQKYNASVATFRPLDGFVLFEREPLPDRAGAIHLVGRPDSEVRREPTWARVVKIGEPLRARRTDARVPFTLRPLDRVLLDSRAGHDVVLDEKSYVLAVESDVLLVDLSCRGDRDPADTNFMSV